MSSAAARKYRLTGFMAAALLAGCSNETSGPRTIPPGPPPEPPPPSLLAVVRQPIAVAGDATCAIDETGTTRCWGNNEHDQLASGPPPFSDDPLPVAGSHVFTALTSGSAHTCGLKSDGSAWCWGANESGGVGDGTPGSATCDIGRGCARTTPHPVAGGVAFTELSAAHDRTCGLDRGGAAWCWGLLNDGEYPGENAWGERAPVPVPGGRTFVAISAASGHTCGIDAEGAGWCWGVNGSWNDRIGGQLGDGTTNHSDVPVRVAGGHRFSAISAGYRHTCAIRVDGTAVCWGDGRQGRLGHGTDSSSAVPVPVKGARRFVSIGSMSQGTCALDDQGQAWCWGTGALGHTETLISHEPLMVVGGHRFSSLAAGGRACALTVSSALYCWGPRDHLTTDYEPTRIHTPRRLVKLSLPGVSTCGLAEAGDAWCWGVNRAGQLGTGRVMQSAVPLAVGAPPFVALSGAGASFCGVTAAGRAYCWGRNLYGVLGIGTIRPVIAPTPVAGDLEFAAVGVSITTSCGLTRTREVWCWGGGLMDGSHIPTPQRVREDRRFITISANDRQVCALDVEGLARCWGLHGAEPLRSSGGELRLAAISAGPEHACGIDRAGTGWCFGFGPHGERGDGTAGNPGPTSEARPVLGGLSLGAISARARGTCALTTEGAAWCWGSNDNGTLGNGTGDWGSGVPVPVSGGITFAAIAAGAAHTCGIAASGQAFCWGWNSRGQLGNAAAAESRTPAAVSGGIVFAR